MRSSASEALYKSKDVAEAVIQCLMVQTLVFLSRDKQRVSEEQT